MRESRRGQVERGFSMTLARLFDARDTGLLLAVCFEPDGAPAAFCQFVPAADIDGYSLDLMRRSDGRAPERPHRLRDRADDRAPAGHGHRGLSLNFAAMRAVLAGEMGDTMGRRMEKRVMERLSDTMQIESLWRYNAKFQPAWRRRYLAYDSPENLVAVGLAVASAEQFWELPVIGRFLKPRSTDSGVPAAPGSPPTDAPDRDDEPVPTPSSSAGPTDNVDRTTKPKVDAPTGWRRRRRLSAHRAAVEHRRHPIRASLTEVEWSAAEHREPLLERSGDGTPRCGSGSRPWWRGASRSRGGRGTAPRRRAPWARLLGEALVHLLGVATRQVSAATAVEEQGVAGHQPPLDEEAPRLPGVCPGVW